MIPNLFRRRGMLVARVRDPRTLAIRRVVCALPLEGGRPLEIHSIVSHEGFPRTDVYRIASDGDLWLERIDCAFEITGNPWVYPDLGRIGEHVGALRFFVGAVGNHVLVHGQRRVALAPLADLDLVEIRAEWRTQVAVRLEEAWRWLILQTRRSRRMARSRIAPRGDVSAA